MPHKTENQQALSHEQYFLEHRYLDSYRFAFKNHCFKKKKKYFLAYNFFKGSPPNFTANVKRI